MQVIHRKSFGLIGRAQGDGVVGVANKCCTTTDVINQFFMGQV